MSPMYRAFARRLPPKPRRAKGTPPMSRSEAGKRGAEALHAAGKTNTGPARQAFLGRFKDGEDRRAYFADMARRSADVRRDRTFLQTRLANVISLADAASMTGMTEPHLRLLARTGKLEAARIGRDWVTSKRAVRRYMADQKARSKDPYKNRRGAPEG